MQYIFQHIYYMNDIALKIKALITEKKITNIELSKNIGKSTKSLYNYLENKTVIDVETLQKIADVFEVSIGYFFNEEIDTNKSKIELLKQENEFLKKRNKEILQHNEKTENLIKLLQKVSDDKIETIEQHISTVIADVSILLRLLFDYGKRNSIDIESYIKNETYSLEVLHNTISLYPDLFTDSVKDFFNTLELFKEDLTKVVKLEEPTI